MTHENEKLIAEVRRLDKAATPGPWIAKNANRGDVVVSADGSRVIDIYSGSDDSGHSNIKFLDLDVIAAFRTAAPALADALEAAERDKAKLVKGMLERWWCPACYGVAINANNEPMCRTCSGTGRHPTAMEVLRSIGIEDIEAAKQFIKE